MVRLSLGLTLVLGAALLGGCPPEQFNHALTATLDDINLVLEDVSLAVNEKRIQLGALGLSPSTINGLLKDDLFGNQFGGDPRSAYSKVADSRFTELTPDEVQIYAGDASNVDTADDLNINLNDTQAQAIVTFFNDFNITSADALQAYLDTPANTVPSTIPEGVLQALFVDFDPALVLPRLP
ncbi:MAG: hypothetical protein KAY37_16400 [Phycisphaerae bacterium]|nr:hypothetical protein [Phycisphaerae bacterium]